MKKRPVPKKLLEKAAMGWCERLLMNSKSPFTPPLGTGGTYWGI